ncbi:MAG: FAD binding domain-containing protein [Gemmatimonadota bacterium]
MKAAPFGYVRAGSVGEAVAALAGAGEDGKLIAGGQSLTPLLVLRLARPSLLIDINPIPGLAEVTAIPGGLRFGALTRHRDLAAQQQHPLLAEAARWIGHTAIRTRGTLGGSLAHADPAAELPVVALATGAVVTAAGQAGRREIPASQLFTGMLETSLGSDEIIETADFPVPQRWGFAEFARRHGDFGLVTVVAAETGGQLRLAAGGVAGRPVRLLAAEAAVAEAGVGDAGVGEAGVLVGGPLDAARVGRAAEAAAGEIDPPADVHATAGYRRALTRVLVTRALSQLAGLPAGPTGPG